MSEDLKPNVVVTQRSRSVEIVGYRQPASLQSKTSKKSQTRAIREAIAGSTDRIFTGDVDVKIEWLINDEDRYLGDAPDVDNIVKPMLDAMCGPSGILIDDVQVQHVSVRWLGGWEPEPRYRFSVWVSPVTGEFLWREGLSFVQVGEAKKVCYPVARQPNLSEEVHERFVTTFARSAQLGRQEPIDPWIGVSATPFLPSRVAGFPVRDFSESPGGSALGPTDRDDVL